MAKRLIGPDSPKRAALFALLTVGFFISTKVGMRLALVQPFATPIWIPAGGPIAAFVVFGYGIWPAVLLGSLLGHITSLGFVGASFVVPLGVVLEGLAGAFLVNTYARGAKAFETARDVFRFAFFTCICAPAINAAIGIAVDYFGGRGGFANSSLLVLSWWLSHGIGALVLAPFFILLFGAPHHRMDLPELAELMLLLSGLFFVCLLAFGPLSVSLNQHQVVRVWLCIPFLIWAAFRFCPLEAAGTTLILFGSAIWGTLHGYGSFVSGNLTVSLAVLDTFVGVIGTTTLVVAAMVVERRRMEEKLLAIQSLLQAKVEGKDRQLAETVYALDREMAVHARTKQSLQDNQEQFRLLAAGSAKDKPQEIQSST